MKQLISFLGGLLLICSCSSSDQEQPVSLVLDNAGNPIQHFKTDSAFLDFIQEAHFKYTWENAEKNSGLSPARVHLDGIYPHNDTSVVAIGASGFGIAALVVGMDRGFISRQQGVQRMTTIVDFLERAERYHGMWAHWIEGNTAQTKPFGKKDNGGDLVESAFLMQGLLIMRQYLDSQVTSEKYIIDKINQFWHEMDWNWYRKNGQNVLFWHWSPDHGWSKNFGLKGYNECLITYILAASSPSSPIPAEVYYEGWGRDGKITNSKKAYGIDLEVKHNHPEPNGGPLFWAHYSYIGLNPKGLKDRHTDYWKATRNQALVNYAYCVDNPKMYPNYGEHCWGITASYSPSGYKPHAPDIVNDRGTITPTAALSSFPYTPKQSLAALKYFYYERGDQLFGEYGFYDAFNDAEKWYPKRYLSIDQNTIIPMIENYRTGLLWKLFMSAPEIQNGLKNLDFEFQLT